MPRDYAANIDNIWDKEDLGIATHRRAVDLRGSCDAVFQWVLEVAAGADPAATINIYSSPCKQGDPRIADLDPATNPFWTLEPAAVFSSYPGTSIGSSSLTLEDNELGSLLFEIIVTSALTSFSLVHRGQARG